jgi:ubiquinone/menaquinone biosynthesis C-methylase UbiE
MKPRSDRRLIDENVVLHERIADKYDQRHPEIYNEIEQDRLKEALAFAVDHCDRDQQLMAMDFGCGTGNLTRHLLEQGCHVTTADVTPSFVEIASRLNPNATTGHILNGSDLQEFPDATFDLIATYSVLHHIPDYQHAVREMLRVLRPGGVIFIDHEASNEHYEPSPALAEFRIKSAQPRDLRWYVRRLASIGWWRTKIRQRSNPRYSEEGDIHVWSDDRIDWSALRTIFNEFDIQVLRDESYLHCQAHYDVNLYEQYRDRCTDMHVLIGKKLA